MLHLKMRLILPDTTLNENKIIINVLSLSLYSIIPYIQGVHLQVGTIANFVG